jgi:putative transposase
MKQEYAFSERRACGLMTVAVSSYRYETKRTDEPLRTRLVELAREKPRFGYRRLHVLLGRSGEHVNHKRVHRVYREAGLMIRRKKRKHCVRVGKPLVARTSADQEWALDFLHDAVECGRAIRVLSVVDAYTRECLALEVDTSFASRRVTRVLDAIVAERGRPQAIRCDNGPELTSRHFLAWCVERQIELVHIQPGKPTQNARVESFHGRLREECLSVSWFQNLFDARRKIAAWKTEYNEERPHSSLGYKTPKEFAAAEAEGFDSAERGARNSNAVPCPSRSPIPAQTGEGAAQSCRILT